MRVVRVAPPQLRTKEQEGKRAATWLELFYDLAFVVAVAVLTSRILEDLSFTGIASYVGYFALLWWLWASHTYYADRYDTDDLIYRLLATGQMVAIVIIAASLSLDESQSTTAFAVGYAMARILLVFMYWRAYRHVEETRALVRGYLVGFGSAAVLWTLSAFVGESIRPYVWAIALIVDLATPWLMRQEQAKVPLDTSHLPERFGLFTILVLGESISAVVLGLSHTSWEFAPTFTAALGIGVAASLWWLYFDNARGSVVRRKASVRRTWRPTGWIYTHLPLAAALAMAGIALEKAIADAGHGAMPGGDRWLLTGSVAAVLGCLALIQFASNDHDTPMSRGIVLTRLLGIPFLLIIGLLTALEPTWVVIGVLAVCITQLVADLSLAARIQATEEHAKA